MILKPEQRNEIDRSFFDNLIIYTRVTINSGLKRKIYTKNKYRKHPVQLEFRNPGGEIFILLPSDTRLIRTF